MSKCVEVGKYFAKQGNKNESLLNLAGVGLGVSMFGVNNRTAFRLKTGTIIIKPNKSKKPMFEYTKILLHLTHTLLVKMKQGLWSNVTLL